MVQLKWRIKPMIYEEFQRQVGKAGLTIREFAELIKMNRNSLSNLSKRGDVPSHLAVIATLLGEMAEHKIDFRRILSKMDLTPKRARGGDIGAFARKKKPL